MWKLLALILLCLILFPTCRSTHFRGAIFMWKPTGKHMEIEVDFRISWRRSDTFCNESTIASRMLLRNSHGYVVCHKNCMGIMENLSFHCTDFSSEDDWTSGKRSFRHSFPSNHTHFEFGFSGGNWIDLVTGVNKPWSFNIMVNLTNRLDKGKANSSPRTDMFPLVRLAYGCNHTIVIPVYDADGDNVRCRWANGSTECAGVCRAFPNSILNEDQCTITYSATDKIGYYAVAIQVEDFRSIGRTTPLSSVPIQFLVYIYNSSMPCNLVPVFLPPTKLDQTFVTVQVHMTVTEQIVAKSSEENTRITEITTTSPEGMKKSLLVMDPRNQGAWYINVTWTPTETDVNSTHILCFSASDEKRLTSAIRCIYFAVIQGLAITSTTGRMKTTQLSALEITDRQDHLSRKTVLSSTTTAAKLVPPAEEATIKFTNTTVLSALRSTPNRTSLPLTGKTTKLITGTLRPATTIMSARIIAVTETNMSLTSRSATTITTMSTTRRHIPTTISQREKTSMAIISLPSNATPIKRTVVMPTATKVIPTSAMSAGQTASATTKFPSGATSLSTDTSNTITPSIKSNTPALRLLQTTPKIAVPISTMTTPMANVPSSATTPTTVLSSSGTSEAAVRSSSLTANVSLPTYNTAAVLSSARTATTTVLLSTTSSTNPPSTTSAPATTVSSLATNDAIVTSLATTMTTSVLSSKELSKTTVALSRIFISTAITSSTTITTSATPPWSTTTTTKMLTESQENISQAFNTEARKGLSTGIEMQWWHLAIAVSVAAIFMTGCCIFFCLFLYKRRQEEENKNKIRVMHSGRDTGQENGNINPSFYRPPPPTKRPSICQPLIPTTPLSYKSPPHYNAWM